MAELSPEGRTETKKNYPAAGVLLIFGSLLSTCSGGHVADNPAPINLIILVAGIVAAGLAFAGAARRTRISLAVLAVVGTLLMAVTARGRWMFGGVPLFDIGAVLALFIGLFLVLGGNSSGPAANDRAGEPGGSG